MDDAVGMDGAEADTLWFAVCGKFAQAARAGID
jgi:hypothetical protein